MSIEATLATDGFAGALAARIAAGDRFAGVYATSHPDGTATLCTLLADDNGVTPHDLSVHGDRYPSLTPHLPAAFWYERAVHDLHGIVPDGHPRLDPLLLPLDDAATRPRPGSGTPCPPLEPDEHVVTRIVAGTGLFTIPHGPVRSGATESVEYLVETPGEDIPSLRLRPFYKHRGIDKRFDGTDPAGAVFLAERVEGVATIAHATAYSHAVEALAGAVVPDAAQYVRVVHAELERLANHLDAIGRLTEAAGLAVAVARFGWHKETVLRLVGDLCGSRFGRGVVVPGGVHALPRLPREAVAARLAALHRAMDPDLRLLMGTSSFLDRLRRTGPLPPDAARVHGALGPVGRASGSTVDVRVRPGYGAYPALGARAITGYDTGDALARLRVRIGEIDESLRLIDVALDRLDGADTLAVPAAPGDGRAIGRAEAPHGEVLYALDVTGGRIARCWPRTASFHNMATFGSVFTGDILTDFPFIEAGYGPCIAGVAL